MVIKISKKFKARRVVKDISLELKSGEIVGLLGPNGAGKTTAVRILTTLLRPDAGRAEVAGLDVVKDANALRSRLAPHSSVERLLCMERDSRRTKKSRRVYQSKL